jgi:hypothetical protein
MIQGPITTFGSGGMPGSIGTLDRSGKPNIRRFYGKYRGKVAENVDPLFLGRILPIVPAVSEFPLTWAMPCVPYAGPGVGFYAIPPIDANVWIEFEGGDPDYPIWIGCFWEEGQAPLEVPTPETFIFKTTSTTMVVRELPGGDGISLGLTFLAGGSPINITLDVGGIQIQTDAVFDLKSQATNISSDEVSVESADTNFSGAALTIESDETNIAGEMLTIESGETNIAGNTLTVESDVTNFLGEAVAIESAEMNILSASLDVESGEFNIAAPAVSLEGTLDVVGAITEDTFPVMVIPA